MRNLAPRHTFAQLQESFSRRPDVELMPEHGRFRLDIRPWPVVVATIPAELGSTEDFLAHLDHITALHRRGPFALVVDVRALRTMPGPHRHLLGAARASDEQRFPGVLRAVATVVHAESMRATITAMGWLRSPSYPQETFDLLDDAVVWAAVVLEGKHSQQRAARSA